jgi:hypothetical protein
MEGHPSSFFWVRESKPGNRASGAKSPALYGRHIICLGIIDVRPRGLRFDIIDIAADHKHVRIIDLDFADQGFLEKVSIPAHLGRRHADKRGFVFIDGGTKGNTVDGLSL